MTVDSEIELGVCVNHPKTETALRCGKCNRFICTRCVIQTPVGIRCKACAQFRRLPQYEVGTQLLFRAAPAGFVVSVVGWYLLSYVMYLRFFLSIFVGLCVGEAISRLARRRSNRALEAVAVCDVLCGLIVVEATGFGNPGALVRVITSVPSLGLTLILPAAIASYVAIVKLR